MQVPKTHSEVCPAYGIPEIGTIFNGTGNLCERRRLELLGGLGAYPPAENFNIWKPFKKRHLQHSQADSCVKKVLKIDHYFS